MKKIISLLVIISFVFIFNISTSGKSKAQGCATNSIGQVICAGPGGGAIRDSLGNVQTGPGQCATNSIGQVECSRVPGGGAMRNSLGQVECTGGCVPGR